MRFVSVARQRNISRIFNDERPRCTDCIESRKPAPRYTQLFVADYERERERTTKPLPISHTNNSSPVSKIVSNRYSKEKKIKKSKLLSLIFEIRKERVCYLIWSWTENWESIEARIARYSFSNLSSLLSRGERTRRERCVDDRYFYRSDATSLPPLEKFIFAVTNAVQEGTEQPRRRHRLRHCLRLRRCLRERGSTRLARFAKAPSRNRTPK